MMMKISKKYAPELVISCNEVEIFGLGKVFIGVCDEKLCFLGLGDTARKICERMFAGAIFNKLQPTQAASWGQKIEQNWKTGTEINIAMVGTDFQQRVWTELLKIKRGQMATYADIAKAVGTKGVRAVGSAIGRNPLSVVVPCHRVVRTDGTMGGYLWGVEVKELILQKEKI